MKADILLARLEGVRPAGDGRWYARCPAHDDKSPSLSIRDTGEKILVLTAVGLDWSDLYPDRWECAVKRPNEAARKAAKRIEAQLDPLDIERMVLAIGSADIKAGKELSIEDRARLQVALERVQAAREKAA
jgi:hypothetical protein